MGADHARLGEIAEALTHFVGNRCYLRIAGDRCIALRVAADGFECRVYERRPAICRAIEPGSNVCQAERDRKLDAGRRARGEG
jgi:Fe-S-cluster containining protein